MKTFFIALILGIFVGLFINNYFSDPEAYAKVQEDKSLLLSEPSHTENEHAAPTPAIEQPEPALFEVASKQLNPEPVPTDATQIKPTPLTQKTTEPESPAPTVIEPELEPTKPVEEPAPKPENTPQPSTLDKAEKLVEEGVEKAAEIAETVKDKVKEATDEAKPQIEQGIENGIDATIALAIRGQYKLESDIDSQQIEVSVADRIVTLSGQLSSEEAKQRAIEIAVFTKGVTAVEEDLKVQP